MKRAGRSHSSKRMERNRVIYLAAVAALILVGCSKPQDTATSSAAKVAGNQEQSVSKTQPVRAAKATPERVGEVKSPSSTQAVAEAKPPTESSEKNAAVGSALNEIPSFSEWLPAKGGMDLLLLASVTSLDALESAMTLVNRPPDKKGDLAKEAIADFQKKFRVADASWFSTDQPMHVLLSASKNDDGGRALILPVSDSKAFNAAMKTFKKKGSKHAFELQAEDKKAYVDVVGDSAVVTYGDDFFAKIQPYLADSFKSYKGLGVAEIRVNVRALRKHYGSDMAATKAWMMKNLGAFIDLSRFGQPQDKGLDNLLGWVQTVIDSVEEAGVAFAIDKETPSLIFGVTPEPAKPLAKAVSSMKTSRSELAQAIHTNAMVAFGGRMESWSPGTDLAQRKALLSQFASIVKLEPAEQLQVEKLIDSLAANQRNDAIFQMYEDEPFPLALGVVSAVEDSAAERKMHQELIGIAFKLLMRNLKTQTKDNRMASLFLKSKSFSELFKNLSLITMPMGLQINVSSDVKDGTAVDVFSVQVDWKNTLLAGRIPQVEKIQQIVGNKLAIAAAYKGKRAAFAFGPRAVEHARTMVDDRGFGSASTTGTLLKDYPLVGEVKLASIAKLLLKHSVPQTPSLLALSALKSTTAVRLTTKSDGSKALFRLSVPASVLRAFR